MTTSTFGDLGLSDDVQRAVKDAGYDLPTPIQTKAIPSILMNRDVLASAQTGTGKTASFTLPMIDILANGRAKSRMPRSIVLAPTRELASQVADSFETYGKYHKLTMALLIGGVPYAPQEKKLDRGVDVLIATPGRLLDHCDRGKVILTDTKMLVIDEADRMLDMGFIPDVERLVAMMPVMRQTIMFSATMGREVSKLAIKFLSNAKEISVDRPSSVAATVNHGVAFITSREKRSLLSRWLSDTSIENGLIFCNRKRDVASLYQALDKNGFSVGALHGDMDQFKRLEWLSLFKTQEIKFLVCSDVAARGLDIAAVSHVFNYDVPSSAEDYVHRIGRTGRAGRAGSAYMMVTEADAKKFLAIEKMINSPLDALSEYSSLSREAILNTKSLKDGSTKLSNAKKTAVSPQNQSIADRPKDHAPDKTAKQCKKTQHSSVIPHPNRDVANLPFGKTDFVPAFLRHSIKV